jgi:ABC-type cobalt transport system substrate-binding protein
MRGEFMKRYILVLAAGLIALAVFCCDMYTNYGKLGGADRTSSADIERILAPKVGVWYSHYGRKRLDGYTIGKWKDVKELLGEEKIALFGRLFPAFDFDNPAFKPITVPEVSASEDAGEDGASDEAEEYVSTIEDEDYFIFYDDTVYGEGEDGSGEGEGGWGFGYMGIVRAVNTFQNSENGAIIIEYLDGCYPEWLNRYVDIESEPLPFFGIYYRVLKPDVIQMANAVELANLFAGLPYYTETATLAEAVEKNNAENDGEFISWGVVIPQDREKNK